MQYIVNFSGGKDSTALLIMALEKKWPIHSAVFFDTGWEFPEMYKHIEKVKKYTGVKIIKIEPEKSFDYWMFKRPVVARKGPNKGSVHQIGLGWPSPKIRWCTGRKAKALDKYSKSISGAVKLIGYTTNEIHRTKTANLKSASHKKNNFKFPLIEWGLDESATLKICFKHGFDWGGLYKYFNRLSCYCCPLHRVQHLKNLKYHFPSLWAKMLKMDARINNNFGFKHGLTVHQWDTRFNQEPRFKIEN